MRSGFGHKNTVPSLSGDATPRFVRTLTVGGVVGCSPRKVPRAHVRAHLCSALLGPHVVPLRGQTASWYSCKNPFNYSVKSSL